MVQWLSETMVVTHYSMVIIFFVLIIVGIIALVLEYKYLDLRNKSRKSK